MKQSKKWTTGLCSSLSRDDLLYDTHKFVFFELDNPFNQEDYNRVIDALERYQLDATSHRTGRGIHILSPTLVSYETWKEIMDELKDINTKCPQQCLRIEPNKWPNESNYWFNAQHWYFNKCPELNNSSTLAKKLNFWFGAKHKGSVPTLIQFVKYRIRYDTK